MAIEITPEQQHPAAALLDWWEPPAPPSDLIFDDGEPLETNRHRIAMNLLIRSVNSSLADRTDFFAGGNLFVYYSYDQVMNRDFRGPDFFVALEVDGSRERFYDQEGNLVLLPEEAAQQQLEREQQRAEQERQRAERLAARLCELEENPDIS